MLTQSEIDAIIAEVAAGTYDVEDALEDIAQKQKGEDVRKALYSLAYTLEQEGKVGSVDLKARGEIDSLTSELANFVADHAGTWGETELWSGEAHIEGADIELQESCEGYDYIDVHYTFNHDSAVRRFPAEDFKDGVSVISAMTKLTDNGVHIAEISIMPANLETPDGINFEIYPSYWEGTGTDVQGVAQKGLTIYDAGSITAIIGVQLVNDLELIDIRDSYDGHVYSSAGYAVRKQIADLHDELDEVKEDIAQLDGLSDDVKTALLQIAQKVAYIDDDGQTYYQDLYDALYPPAPPATLVSISAVYTQSGTVYDTDTLDSLKSDLVVTAHYDDSTTETVTTYTLSGTLTTGTSTITVSYGGKTTTFTVTVTSNTPLHPFVNGTHTFTTYPQVVTVTNGNTAEVILAQNNNKDVHANVSDVTANTTNHSSTDNYLNNNTKWFTIHADDTVRMKGTVNSVVKASDTTKAAIVLRDMSKTNVFPFMVDVLLKDLTENQVIEYSSTFESDTDIACLGWYMGSRGTTQQATLSMTFELYVNDVRYV